MTQLEMSSSEQKIQAFRDRFQGEGDHRPREYEDRRRPGRLDHVNPNLVPLLCGAAVPRRLLGDEIDQPYGLKHAMPMLGIAVSVILSIPLWGVLGLVAWAIVR